MKKRIIQFLTTYFLFVLLFVLQKPIFMVYYHDLYTNVSLGDYFRVMWHGLPLDLSLAGYLTAIPGLLLIASAWTNSSILRRIRQGYFGVIAFIMACIFILTWAILNCYTRIYLGVHYPGDLLVGGIIGGFGGWLFCTIAHKAAIYLEPSTRTKRKEIKQWSVTIYVGLLTILGIVLYSTIKSW